MNKYRISYVSYLNTIPFRYALENSNKLKEYMELQADIPSECAQKLLTDRVDIGLVPVAILPRLKEYHIISDYCIGSERKVGSVILASDVPLEEIETVLLDYQSRTSVMLARVLADNFWNIQPQWKAANKGYEKQIKGTTAGVIIGDRVFQVRKKYIYDLSEEWYSFSRLPFVFATWVANKNIEKDFIKLFNLSLEFGLNHLDEAIEDYGKIPIPKKDLKAYLSQKISYFLTAEKKKAMNQFLSYVKEYY